MYIFFFKILKGNFQKNMIRLFEKFKNLKKKLVNIEKKIMIYEGIYHYYSKKLIMKKIISKYNILFLIDLILKKLKLNY